MGEFKGEFKAAGGRHCDRLPAERNVDSEEESRSETRLCRSRYVSCRKGFTARQEVARTISFFTALCLTARHSHLLTPRDRREIRRGMPCHLSFRDVIGVGSGGVGQRAHRELRVMSILWTLYKYIGRETAAAS